METFVLDCSATVSFFFKDEYSPLTDAAFEALSDYAQAWVPSLWPLEVANACLIAERKKRIRITQIWEILTILESFPIHVESALSPANVREIVTLAQKHKLTSYDAAYLELAIRRSIPPGYLGQKIDRGCTKREGAALDHDPLDFAGPQRRRLAHIHAPLPTAKKFRK